MRSTNRTYELSSPFVGFLRKNLRLQWKKRSHVVLREYRYIHPREAFGFGLTAKQGKKLRESREKECKRERGEKGVHICMPSRSLTAVRTDNSRVLFLRSSTGGIGIQRGKWKRISSVPPAVPMATRATNFSSTFTSSFPSSQVLSYYLKFQPSRALFPFPHRRVAPFLPNNMLFPLATSTSESLLRSLNPRVSKLSIKRICIAKQNFRMRHWIIAHSSLFQKLTGFRKQIHFI